MRSGGRTAPSSWCLLVLAERASTFKSPADECLRPFEVDNFIGKKLSQPLTKDQALTYAAIGKAAEVA